MRDDQMMDGILRTAMAAPQPEMSPTFAQDVLRRTAPRRLAPGARVAMWAYAVVSAAVCVWMMRDLPVAVTATAMVAQAVVALGVRLRSAGVFRRRSA
jgi:hypothetical protein